MAIFGWKSKGEGKGAGAAAGEAPAGGGAVTIPFDDAKAAKFFQHAKAMHDSTNFEYAMTLWLQGVRQNPASTDGVKGFLGSASAWRAGENAKKATREMQKVLDGSTPVDRYVGALLDYGCRWADADAAGKAALVASELGLAEVAMLLGPRALSLQIEQPKPRRDALLKLMELFEKNGKYEFALTAGETALRLDPSDTGLRDHLRNLAAQSTMSKGGYEKVGQEGGFRQNVRDSDKQRQLEEQERISKSDAVADRVVAQMKAAYEATPQDRPTINKYLRSLVERGGPGDAATATAVAEKAYADTQDFQFRRFAGDVRLKLGRLELKALKAAADANPADPAAAEAFRAAEARQLLAEIAEYEARIAAYPTDLGLKYELGERYRLAGRHEDAVAQFQFAKNDPKNKNKVLNSLGVAFQAMGWADESVQTLRDALDGYPDPTDDLGMQLRYNLMTSLQQRAEETRDLASAEEALKLAQAIGVHQIGYRDIRARRDDIRTLMNRLRGGDA